MKRTAISMICLFVCANVIPLFSPVIEADPVVYLCGVMTIDGNPAAGKTIDIYNLDRSKHWTVDTDLDGSWSKNIGSELEAGDTIKVLPQPIEGVYVYESQFFIYGSDLTTGTIQFNHILFSGDPGDVCLDNGKFTPTYMDGQNPILKPNNALVSDTTISSHLNDVIEWKVYSYTEIKDPSTSPNGLWTLSDTTHYWWIDIVKVTVKQYWDNRIDSSGYTQIAYKDNLDQWGESKDQQDFLGGTHKFIDPTLLPYIARSNFNSEWQYRFKDGNYDCYKGITNVEWDWELWDTQQQGNQYIKGNTRMDHGEVIFSSVSWTLDLTVG